MFLALQIICAAGSEVNLKNEFPLGSGSYHALFISFDHFAIKGGFRSMRHKSGGVTRYEIALGDF